MNNLYICKITETQASGKQIDIPNRIGKAFFKIPESYLENSKNFTLHISHSDHLTDFEEIELQTATNLRFSTKLNRLLEKYGDKLEEGDLIIFDKVDRLYTVRSIKKTDLLYSQLLTLFEEERHMLLTASNNVLQNNNHSVQNDLPLQQIYYGAPGTGKSYTINAITQKEQANTIRTTFHPDTDYSSFVGAYKPTTKEFILRDLSGHKVEEDGKILTEEKIVYEFVFQSFLNAYVNAWINYSKATEANKVEKQYLVIEEINRGNCAQIFGDLFQLLDRNDCGFSDYPIEADADMSKQLRKKFDKIVIPLHASINALYENTGRDIVKEVLDGKILLLPNNLYIWATMNTSDQSLFPIDSAFKRRWDWEYMPISDAKEGWTISANGNSYDWWHFLEAINKLIGTITYSEDKKLGYFFCKAGQDKVISARQFVGKVIFYLWNDVFKDYGFDSEVFTDIEEGGKLTFNKFYTSVEPHKNVINEIKVEMFLKNLGLEPTNNEIFNNDDDSDIDLTNDDIDFSEPDNNNISSANRDKYSINGFGKYGKCRAPFEAVKKYAESNPNMSAVEISHKWTSLNIKHLPHFVETESEFNERRANTSDAKFDSKAKKLVLHNGQSIYISNQFNPERINDLITKLDSNNWNIRIIPFVE